MALTDALRSMRLPALPGGLDPTAFVERWREALTSCLPEVLRRALAPREQGFVIVPQGSRALLCQGKGEQRQLLGELDPDSPGAMQAVLAGVKRGGGRGRTIIELAADQVISRSVTFPVQVRNNLAQVVGYEIDRLTPFRSDQVCFDFRLPEAQPRGERLGVEIALCRRDQLKDWLKWLRDAGAPAEQVTWEGAWPKANLLPPQERPQRGVSVLSANKILLLLVVLLTAAVIASPIWQKKRLLEQLDTELADLRSRSDEVYQVRDAIELARQGSLAVLERKSEQPRMTDLLRELTERLPDDTWVQNLDYNEGEVQIRGESSQAAALIRLLEQAPGITDVAFRSPVVQVASTGQERFHISFGFSRADSP
jgi:general secretion pathway protein L